MLQNKKPTFNVGVSGCYKTSSLLSRFLNEHSVLKDHLLHTYLFYFKPPLLLCNLSIPIARFTAVFAYVPSSPGFIILLHNKRITFKVQILVHSLSFLGANVDQLSLCAEMMYLRSGTLSKSQYPFSHFLAWLNKNYFNRCPLFLVDVF